METAAYLKIKTTMITYLTITFNKNGINYSMQIPTVDVNIPYYLADMFEELIKQTNANEEMVLEKLIGKFGYNKGREDD